MNADERRYFTLRMLILRHIKVAFIFADPKTEPFTSTEIETSRLKSG
jgi:hypothetical protein